MTEKVKNRLCELVGYKYWPQNLDCNEDIELAILIKAKWELDKQYCDLKSDYRIREYKSTHGYEIMYKGTCIENFGYSVFDLKNRQEALTAALEYVIENQPAAESATNADDKH